MNVLNTLVRKADVRFATPREYVRQRVASQATMLTLAGRAAARVELANEALCAVTSLVYEQDADGSLPNVDAVSYRLRLPLPWGASGWRWYGLRQWEARTLNRILRSRPAQNRPPLYLYDDQSRTWHVNLSDYGTIQAATHWLKRSAVRLSEWQVVRQKMCQKVC